MGRVGDGVLGCEETEFCIRLSHAKPDAVILYNPLARVEHLVPDKRASVRYFARALLGRGPLKGGSFPTRRSLERAECRATARVEGSAERDLARSLRRRHR